MGPQSPNSDSLARVELTSWGPMPEEADNLTTRVTSALFLQNTVTAVMGTSLLEKLTVLKWGAGTVGAVREEEAMRTHSENCSLRNTRTYRGRTCRMRSRSHDNRLQLGADSLPSSDHCRCCVLCLLLVSCSAAAPSATSASKRGDISRFVLSAF